MAANVRLPLHRDAVRQRSQQVRFPINCDVLGRCRLRARVACLVSLFAAHAVLLTAQLSRPTIRFTPEEGLMTDRSPFACPGSGRGNASHSAPGVGVAGGSIPIEQSRAAVFLTSGSADTISRPGAAILMGDLLIERLRRSKHPYPNVHLSYPEAGVKRQEKLIPKRH
jgi:hypothetical protein